MMNMAYSPTTDISTTEDDHLPDPDLPCRSSVHGACVSSFISLQFKPSHIHIRQQELDFVRASNMNSQCSDNKTTRNIHTSHQPSEINHDLIVEKRDSWQCSPDYASRLETFGNWPHRFLDPAVLAEATFCYTGHVDTVRCTQCGGELSNWIQGDDPSQEHLNRFGFSCD